MKRSAAIRIWNGLLLALVLLPLAIFWSGRGDVFPHDPGSPDQSLLRHILASVMYVSMVVLAAAWLRSDAKHSLLLGVLTLSPAIGAAVAFEGIGEAAVREAGVSGLGFDVAIVIIVYLSASFAAWLLLWSVVTAVRRRRARQDRG